MEPRGSLPHSQEPATCPYPEPAQSHPWPPSHVLKIHFNIILPSMGGYADNKSHLGHHVDENDERKYYKNILTR
jgi:hypothetical protein